VQSTRPAKLIDPVCGMTVDVDRAEADGLLLEHEGRTYAFCRAGCRRAFLEEPAAYTSKADSEQLVAQAAAASNGLPVIDEGIRRWYENCSCCLSDVYPELKAQLDAERAMTVATPVAPGICEIADAHSA
jgi:YHS domain-containing protein